MTRVGTVDHVLLLLREQLQRMDSARTGRSGRAGARGRATLSPMARLRGLSGFADLDEEEFRRTLVRALLSEELGDAVANDPNFQSVVDDVFRIIGDSDEGRELMARAADRIRHEGAGGRE